MVVILFAFFSPAKWFEFCEHLRKFISTYAIDIQDVCWGRMWSRTAALSSNDHSNLGRYSWGSSQKHQMPLALSIQDKAGKTIILINKSLSGSHYSLNNTMITIQTQSAQQNIYICDPLFYFPIRNITFTNQFDHHLDQID